MRKSFYATNRLPINLLARYVMEANGNVRTLTINKSNLSDDAAYECVVGEDKCSTEVYVKGASSPHVYRLAAIIHWKLQPRNTMK